MSNRPESSPSDPTAPYGSSMPPTHWVSDPTTGEYPVANAPTPKRRRVRGVAAALAAAAVAGFSGYAVGHVMADPATPLTQIEQSTDDQQQGPGGGQPPTGDFPGQPPGSDQGTDQGSGQGTDEGTTQQGTGTTTGA